MEVIDKVASAHALIYEFPEVINITQQKWEEQYVMVRRLIAKAQEPWSLCVQLVQKHRYSLSSDSWGRPEILGQYYRVRLSCDYPDARRVVVCLYHIESFIEVRQRSCHDLLEGVKQAIEWLDQLERRKMR